MFHLIMWIIIFIIVFFILSGVVVSFYESRGGEVPDKVAGGFIVAYIIVCVIFYNGLSSGEDKKVNHSFTEASYGKLIKSEDYEGRRYRLENAEVTQAREQNDGTTMIMAKNYGIDDFLFYIIVDGKTNLEEGSVFDATGYIDKIKDYETQAGGNNTVPSLKIDSDDIEIQKGY